jgi:hypothetical protein
VDAKAWSFRIDGLVKNPLRFNYEEIRALPRYETPLALECISNPVGGRVEIFSSVVGILEIGVEESAVREATLKSARSGWPRECAIAERAR